MNRLSKNVGTKLIVSGAILTAAGFVIIMANLLNVYGKASNSSAFATCPKTSSSCGLSANIWVSHIGTAIFLSGLVVILAGAIVLSANRKGPKR